MGKKGKKHHHPPHHHDHEWMYNVEKEEDLNRIGSTIEKIGKLISERGYVKLGNVTIKPPKVCYFVLRYERMPEGELKLKIELEWEEDEYPEDEEQDELKIE